MTDKTKSRGKSPKTGGPPRPDQDTSHVGGVAGDRLKQYIERVERLEEESAGIREGIRDIYAEAKSAGFETKVMRQIVKLRKMDHQKRMEMEELVELYKSAIGLN